MLGLHTGLAPGTGLYLINEGPDEPFSGGAPGTDFAPADPQTTGQVMRFSVVDLVTPDTSVPPGQHGALPAAPKPGSYTVTRQVSLNEEDSAILPGAGPEAALLGTLNPAGSGHSLGWDDPITENVAVGATEACEMYNFTADAHPIHIHEVQFEVLDRQLFGGSSRPREPLEAGLKDTVIAYPGEITRVKRCSTGPGCSSGTATSWSTKTTR